MHMPNSKLNAGAATARGELVASAAVTPAARLPRLRVPLFNALQGVKSENPHSQQKRRQAWK